jgi:hypothetical protein
MLPLFFPPVRYRASLDRVGRGLRLTVEQLCARAGVPCRASGAWVDRPVIVCLGERAGIEAEPGDWSPVRVVVPTGVAAQRYRWALGAMAYAVHDPVARESVRAAPWARPAMPRGRPRRGAALSGAQRQRRHREKLRRVAARS